MTYEEEDEEDEQIGETNISLLLTKSLKDKMDYLSSHYEKEIGGFLTYSEITIDENKVKIVLNDLLIPYQDVSSASVDLEGKDLIELRKEYGDKCLKIIGHFHSHNSMGTFFSSTDEDMMKQYSQNKNFCIFIVSSKGKHLIRLVLKNNPYEISIDNIPYEVEFDDNVKKEMQEEIQKKIRKEKKTEKTTITYTDKNEEKLLKKEINARVKYFQHNNHSVKVERIYKYYAKAVSEEFKTLNPIIEKSEEEEHYNVLVELGNKNKAKEFMVDVKAFLLKTLMEEREKEDKKEEEDDTLVTYLSELEEEDYLSELERLEDEGILTENEREEINAKRRYSQYIPKKRFNNRRYNNNYDNYYAMREKYIDYNY